jgi:hypothetical protein
MPLGRAKKIRKEWHRMEHKLLVYANNVNILGENKEVF